MASLNLQRNSEVFFSTVDILGTVSGSASVAVAMTPANTWKLEVLAGFAVTSTSATQDITSLNRVLAQIVHNKDLILQSTLLIGIFKYTCVQQA